MIRVLKPATPPAILTDRGRKNGGPRLAAELARRAEETDGPVKVRDVCFNDKTVKRALIEAQHGKCCFCEQRVDGVAHGHVEHYRPKGGWVQAEGDPLTRPGYYWLAYDWANLYLACELCNGAFKKNQFPLTDPAARARSHRDDVTREAPLLIDPGAEDPEALIGWRAELPVPKFPPGTPEARRASETIRITGIDRPVVNGLRLDHLKTLRKLPELRRLLTRLLELGERPAEPLRVRLAAVAEEIADATAPTAPFAAMSRVYLGPAGPR